MRITNLALYKAPAGRTTPKHQRSAMKRLIVCVLSLIVVVLFVGSELRAQDAPRGELRIWKDATGQFSIEAVFVQLSGESNLNFIKTWLHRFADNSDQI